MDRSRIRLAEVSLWLSLSLALVLASSLTACTGMIGEPGAGPSSDPPGTDPGLGDPAGPWRDPWADGCTDPAPAVGESPLRRLTRLEYRNSVRDLLDTTLDPTGALGEDEHVGPFRANVYSEPSSTDVGGFTEAAQALAADAVSRLDALLPCARADGATCAETFARDLARRAWRRPIEEDEATALMEIFALADGFDEGVGLVIEAILESPYFLYVVEGTGDRAVVQELDPYETATRLSLFLWRTTPDDALLAAASEGRLSTPDDIEREARRMIGDEGRMRATLESFYFEWLGLFGTDSVPSIDELTKDASVHTLWSPELAADMRAEVVDFVTHLHAPDGDGRLETLLGARHSFLTPRLAELYGVAHPTGSGVARVDFPAGVDRSGILTLPGLLAVYGKQVQSAPVQRGVLVRERILCLPITPPPPGIMANDPPFDPTKTRREQFEEHGTSACGASCHATFDPLGFAFEHYDGIGQFRVMDGPEPVDATGSLPGADVDRLVDGVGELAAALAESETVRTCVTRQWVRFALAREVDDGADRCAMRALRERFRESGDDLRTLLVAVAKSDLLVRRSIGE